MIVLDASIAVSWFFSDESDAIATASSARLLREGGCVPAIFPAECANALVFAQRKRRITRGDVRAAVERLARLPLRVESRGCDIGDEVLLADRHRLTVYDAMYLALARRHRLTLLTRDHALLEAARKEGVAENP